MTWIGVDPGSRTGAYAIINDDSVVVKPWDDYTFRADMANTAYERESHGEKMLAVVEKVGAMPKQGLSSTWAFARNVGIIEGILIGLWIPYQLVPPRVWKKEFSLTSDKAKSVEVCHRLFPDVSLKRTEKSHKDDNNLAEALLMAEYARRIGG